MTDDEADHLIDAQLRNVPVPAGLALRLAALSTWPDAELENEIAAVAVPSSLVGRLRNIPTDELQDHRLRDVSLPERLRVALRKVPVRDERWHRVALRAIAASWLLAITLGYTSFAWQLLTRARTSNGDVPTLVFLQTAPVSLEAENNEPEVLFTPDQGFAFAEDDGELPGSVPVDPWLNGELEVARPTPVENVLRLARDTRLDAPLYARNILGAAPTRGQEELPPLDLVRLPEPRGIATPLVPGYDRAFLLRTGVHPPIFPGMNATLRQSLAPLSVATNSFDAALIASANKRRLPAEEIRTEDFVAAMSQELPSPAAGELNLQITAGPSRFGPEGTRLISLGVKAGQPLRRDRSSTHLVVAIDFSSALGRSGQWIWVREALLELIDRLGTDDRVSLVFYQDEVLMGSAPLDRSACSTLRQRLAGAIPFGDMDPTVGLEAAFDVALAAETPAVHRQVVVLTGGQFDLATHHRERIRRVADQAAKAGVRFDLVTLGGHQHVSEGSLAMAKAMRVQQRMVDTRRELLHGLLGALHGDEAITAAETKLVVRFNPEAVAAYRLIGHEANTMAQLVSPATVAELRSGDEATALFEILPIGGSKAETIAEAELTWLPLGSDQPRTIRRSLGRSELGQPWDSTPLTFRATAISAECAEQLRGSREALQQNWKCREPATLAGLIAEVKSMSSASDTSSALRSLLPLLETAAAQPGRGR